jgi:WD40 repeat protein
MVPTAPSKRTIYKHALESYVFSQRQYSLTFDALLVGHEAGVTSVSWQPGKSSKTLTLLSTSTDSSLILWSPSDVPVTPSRNSASSSTVIKASLWMNRQRFGDVGGVKPGGFVGGLWARGGKEVLGFGWNGSWRRWRDTSPSSDDDEAVIEAEKWVEIPAVLGHNAPVRGLGWDPEGNYLISTRPVYPIDYPNKSSSWLPVAWTKPLEYMAAGSVMQGLWVQWRLGTRYPGRRYTDTILFQPRFWVQCDSSALLMKRSRGFSMPRKDLSRP